MFKDGFIFDLQRFVEISNTASNTLLSGTNKADEIYNTGSFVTIDAGDGNDYVENVGPFTSISGGAGNDRIKMPEYHYVSDLTISGGAGDDRVTINNTSGTLIEYASGDGNDTIFGINESDTLTITGGSYYTIQSGNDVVVTVGSGSIILKDAKGKDLNINRTITPKLITLTDDRNDFENRMSDVTIDARAGSDYIENYGNNVLLLGKEGNDTLINYGSNVTIDAYDYSDNIKNYGDNVSIGVDVQDEIYNSGSNVTIYAGESNATISGSGQNVLFQYDNGKIRSVIYNFNSDDTLQIGGRDGSYSTTKSGNDVVVTVDQKGHITLVGAASLATLNIDGNSWRLDGTTATYGSADKTLITVSGVRSLDGISLDGKVVTVSKASLGTGKVSISGDGYTLKLGSNVSTPTTKEAWSLSKTTAKYKQTITAGYTLEDNSITYSEKSSKVLVTVKGVTSLDGLSVKGKVVTVSASSLGTKNISISDGYTLALGSDVDAASTKKAWSFSNSTATYKQTTSEGYALEDNAIVYSAQASETLAKVKGATTKSGLKVSGTTIKLPASALSNKVTVSGAYTFDFASDYSKATILSCWLLAVS